jgi:hypothetical protein
MVGISFITVLNFGICVSLYLCEISSSHGGEYDVQICLLGYTAV